jgi:hypothetical protein
MTIDYVRVYAHDSNSGGGATGPITGLAGKCVDVEAANVADGTRVQLYTCNGTNAQRWTVGSDGTIRALGKCLDVSGGATADGARVQFWTCNGTGAQRWTYTAGRDLVNPQADKCLTSPATTPPTALHSRSGVATAAPTRNGTSPRNPSPPGNPLLPASGPVLGGAGPNPGKAPRCVPCAPC